MKKIKIVLIAHNAKAYDAQFILKHCISCRFTPNVIKIGTKILQMNINQFTFIDSLSFLQMPLKRMPFTFGFEDSVLKGDLPHLFNSEENWNYRGKWPALHYYQPDLLAPKERDRLIEWHDAQEGKTFYFQEEIKNYSHSDVHILMKSMMIFRDIWKRTSGLDCFTRCFTLPQAVMEIYKTNYMPSNEIPIVPTSGYEPKRKQSYIANSWLDFMQQQREFTILREYKLGQYYADGFIPETREVFEFNGCIFHGCPVCFASKRVITRNPYTDESMESLYQKCLRKQDFFLQGSYISP